MTRIAIAGISHETNTFSPIPTPYESFIGTGGDGRGIMHRDALVQMRGKKFNNGICGIYEFTDKEGYEVEPLLFASTTPSAQVTRDAFERISDEICTLLKENGPFDGLYLSLHGAMVVEDFQDGETELLRKVRKTIGDIPVVASLDLHGNITAEAVELSSAMVGFRTYPHIDIYETGYRCGQVLKHILQGKPLFKAYKMLPIMIPLSCQTTNAEPAHSVYAYIDELEKIPGVVSVSYMMGFPPADVYHAGPTVFTFAETQALADETAQKMYDLVLSYQSEWVCKLVDVETGVKQAMQLSANATKPVIIADVQDNAGAGSTSDTPWILESLVKNDAKGAVVGLIYDPESAEMAHKAGVGTDVKLKLGGKLIPGQKPYEAVFTIENLAEGDFVTTGPMGKGRIANLGKMALLRIGDVRVVVSSSRVQANDQSYFCHAGVNPADAKILVLKSSHHYRADFEPISSAIIQVEAPAAVIDDPAKTPYRNLRKGVRLGGNGPVFEG